MALDSDAITLHAPSKCPEVTLQDPAHPSLLEGAQRSPLTPKFLLSDTVNLIDHKIFRKLSMLIWKICTQQQNTLNSFFV